MSIYDTIKKYGKGKGEDTMWKSVEMLSSELKDMLTEEEYSRIDAQIYCVMEGGHYNEKYALEQCAKISPAEGMPYIHDAEIIGAYESVRNAIQPYNQWDWLVAFRMIASDYYGLLRKWWQGASPEALTQKLIELTTTYLADEDSPLGKEKIWRYFHCG